MPWAGQRKNSPRRLTAQVSLRLAMLLMLLAAVFCSGWSLGRRQERQVLEQAMQSEREAAQLAVEKQVLQEEMARMQALRARQQADRAMQQLMNVTDELSRQEALRD